MILGLYKSSIPNFHLIFRYSATFNAFIANLPQMLDANTPVGTTMLPLVVQILLFAPNPSIQAGGGLELMHNISLTYSLWYLDSHVRRNWLMSILVILYKYQYVYPPLVGHIENVIRVVLNSIEAQFHQCRRIPATVMMDMPPSRSQPSLGTDGDERELSPPLSPMPEGSSTSSRPRKIFKNKLQDSSVEGDDTDELGAIPESDMSDSTLHGSAPNSFDDNNHFDEVAVPFKADYKNRVQMLSAGGSTSGGTERREERIETTKRTNKYKSHSKSIDRDPFSLTTTTTTVEAVTSTTVHTKCSVQEGVRMMVASSIGEKAVINPPIQVQKAIVVTQKPQECSTSKMMANIASNQLKAFGAFVNTEKRSPSIEDSSSEEKKKLITSPPKPAPTQPSTTTSTTTTWTSDQRTSPRTLGRTKKIIESTAPIGEMNIPSTSSVEDSFKVVTGKPPHKKSFKHIERNTYGSPESPLSKMDLMSPPASDNQDTLMSPKSISSLEIPTQERLLPIGAKEISVTALADRVREALVIPDISHLKQDSTEKSESTSSPREEVNSSRVPSPRRLTKQTALESPPHGSDELHPNYSAAKAQGSATRQRLRKVGPFAVGSQTLPPETKAKFAGSFAPRDDSDPEDEAPCVDLKQSSYRVGDECVSERCMECGAVKEIYTDEEMGLFLVILGTFIHREPAIAAPYLPDILQIVSKYVYFDFNN